MTPKSHTPATSKDDGLRAFFDAERNVEVPVSVQLLENIRGDALAIQAHRSARPVVARGAERRGWFDGVWGAFGGAQVAAVLGIFLLVGISLGVAEPDVLVPLSNKVLSAAGMPPHQNMDFTLDDLTGEG